MEKGNTMRANTEGVLLVVSKVIGYGAGYEISIIVEAPHKEEGISVGHQRITVDEIRLFKKDFARLLRAIHTVRGEIPEDEKVWRNFGEE